MEEDEVEELAEGLFGDGLLTPYSPPATQLDLTPKRNSRGSEEISLYVSPDMEEPVLARGVSHHLRHDTTRRKKARKDGPRMPSRKSGYLR